MNILFINLLSFDFLGGVEFHILNLSRQLLRLGHSVTLVCDGEAGTGENSHEGVRIIRVKGVLGLRRFLREKADEYDVCHGHMSRKLFSMVGVTLAKHLGRPTVFTPHCFYPPTSLVNEALKGIYDQVFTRATLSSSDRVINLTPRDQDFALNLGLPPSRSRIIPNSIDVGKLLATQSVDFRERFGIERDYLLHVGRFQAHKHIDFLVRQQLRMPELDLVLIGQDDGELQSVQRLVEKLALSQRVHIIVSAKFNEICGAYKQAAVLVMASRMEGLPTVVLEAMAFQVPVVVPSVGGIPFIVEHGETGFLFPWDDCATYLNGVRDALKDRERITRNASADLYKRFSWEMNAARIEDLYAEIANGSRTSESAMVVTEVGATQEGRDE